MQLTEQIKMKVDVCGIPFEVQEVESNCRADGSMGRSDTKMAIITLNKEMPKEVKESTLIHEWLHAVFDCMGFGECSNDEKKTGLITGSILLVFINIKENYFSVLLKIFLIIK